MLWGEEREESWPQCGAERCGLALRSAGPGVSRACVGASTRCCGACSRGGGERPANPSYALGGGGDLPECRDLNRFRDGNVGSGGDEC